MHPLGRPENWTSRLGLIAALGMALILLACERDTAGDGGEMPGDGSGGAQVFAKNCTVCHGAGGRAPGLSQIRALSPEARAERIRAHPVAGRIPQRLSASDLAGVIEFLEQGSPEALAVGPTDLVSRECGACHGGGRGPALNELMGLSRAEIQDRLSNHPVAGDIPQRLIARDLAVLIEYLNAN